jgi:molecular chaperone DnaK (HSP70)
MCYNLIRRTDNLEIRREETGFSTVSDGQTAIEFCFYENESDELWKEIDPNEEIQGRGGEISWGRPVPRRTPVKIVVERDKSGRIRVYAECSGAKGEFEIVTPGCGLTR